MPIGNFRATHPSTRAVWRVSILGLVGLAVAGCHTDMWVQPKTEPLRVSEFYSDGASARPLIAGTIAREHLREDEGYFTGQTNGRWLKDIPIEVNLALLQRGQERFNVFCSPCHGRLGDGNGMIANRGFELRRPVGNYHTDRLRKMPAGHFYDVITNGYGAMYSYASRVEPQDRWAIVAYIRALQLAGHANAEQAGRARAETPAAPVETKEGGAAH
jgi:mono/diheme cytochrome c family protein